MRSASASLEVGQIVDGRYRVIERLGQGGMGEVYAVEHVHLGRREALKVLKPQIAADPQFVARFRREARATNRVQHPNIVLVHDFGRLPDGRFYLSMEYADGPSLREILNKRGALPLDRALHILEQLVDAVQHAHGQGVVHRDLKPDNLILVRQPSRADLLKVLDFGLAKITAPDYVESRSATPHDEILGTPEYMSPEQFMSASNDPRADLYAIGCIAYELLSGAPPFPGRAMEVMHAHLTRPPVPLAQKAPAARIPPAVDELILRCLAKRPEDRPQSARELLVGLGRIPGFRLERARIRQEDPDPQFFPEDTVEEAAAVIRGRLPSPEDDEGAESAVTQPVAVATQRRLVRLGVRRAAEALLDLGQGDFQLVIDVAELKQLEDDLAARQRELQALGPRAEALEQRAKQREASLRFALGELRFELDKGADPAAVAARISEIEVRLRENQRALDRGLAQLEAERTRLASARADVERSLDTRCTALLQRIEALPVEVIEGDAALKTHLQEVRRLRA
jgi:hypothetical protein